MKSKEKKAKLKSNTIKVNNKKGITLIALVVTIIVLLILAGITIASIAGENGILNRASEAREQTEEATEDEQRQLAMAEAAMNLENTEYDGVTIPAGFAPTRIEGEDSVDDGLVIIDSEGNEFVWIPCTLNEYNNAIMKENWLSSDEYKSKEPWRNDYTKEDVEKLNGTYINDDKLPTEKWQSENKIENTTTSIRDYGGFYIARYEAGIPKEAESFYVSKSETNSNNLGYKNVDGKSITNGWASSGEEVRGSFNDTSEIKNFKPVSKKGYQVWNFITQPNSKLIAENMYDESSSVKSDLVDGHAWNTICNKFATILNSGEEGKSITDSSNIGNYVNNKKTKYEDLKCLNALHKWENDKWIVAQNYKSTVGSTDAPKGEGNNRLELATGASDDFKVYNIYDMAGNIWEWNTEHSIIDDKMFVVIRGRWF